ncbi:conserved hypothetical protein [Methanolacinia petrolearia DSM 11571]|uniref:Uncharacterized protein n=1 Tax=Methanolacinia petrolearia (strain DSM 11571 / OCM 486 / SEBR 4847) TaxID=679926 RepID=E1RJI5_METP4|nr:hypothetical protein [Methanolacinia petrolearia]ADN36791.1 conserved hypothetical protein [Methanolacinia petrolearia DSM 11571]
MSRMSDAIPLYALEDIALLDERAVELERRAHSMLYEAEDLRRRGECIREHYRDEVEKHGYDECVRRAQADDNCYTARVRGVC